MHNVFYLRCGQVFALRDSDGGLNLGWMGLGVGIYLAFGRPDNLLLDSLKDLALLVLTWQCQAQRLVVRR